MVETDNEAADNEVLRLLLVEDSDDDAELIAWRLSRANMRFELRRVQTEGEFRLAMQECFDLVISDYSLPGFGAMSVLDILHEAASPVPVMIVSGAIGEECAANAMKRGAVDYLLKDRLGRLPQAVVHAVENARVRERLEEKRRNLAAALERMAHLSHELVAAQERERKALARELHDELGQRLTSLNLILYRLQPYLQDPAAARIWRDAERELSGLFGQVREMSVSLRPPVLDHFGLEAAIHHLVERQLGNARIAASVEVAGLPESLGSLAEITAYRVVQESLTNVVRHAQASRVVVEVNGGEAGDELEIVVRDNGAGFDALRWSRWSERQPGPRASSGLCGMRERVELLGGRFHVESGPQGGTRITATLPPGSGENETS